MMFYFVIAILSIFLILFLEAFIWRYRRIQLAKKIGLTGPKPNIIFGNLLDFLKVGRESKEKTTMILVDWHKTYGETFAYYLGVPFFRISTINKQFIKEVFIKQFSKFIDRELFAPMLDGFPMKESLLQIGKTGPRNYGWKEIRSIVSPAFTTGKMKLMYPIINERIETLIQILTKKAKQNSTINIYDDFQALTMDVIGRSAFGVDADSLNDRNDVFYVQGRTFFNAATLEDNLGFLIGFISRPIGYLFKPFAPMYKSQKIISDNLRKVIDYRKKNIQNYKRIDLIQLLLEEDNERQKRDNKPPMHIDTIVSICFGFMVAGYETTSTALAFAAWFLAKHPEVQEKLNEEIKNTLKDTPADYDTAMKMPYMDAVFKESLRLKPPVVTFTGRTCIEDTVIQGIKITKGTRINVPVLAVHWNEDNWENPMEFIPERFMGEKDYDHLNWIPFGIGPRFCAGMRFAELEFKLALIEIVRRFKLELSGESEDSLKCRVYGILHRPLGDVYVKISPR